MRYLSIYSSGSQPGCRGTQGCREEVLGVPPNIKFAIFFIFFTAKGAPNCHFSQVRVPPIFFPVLQGALNQKRLKNTDLQSILFFVHVDNTFCAKKATNPIN